MKIHFINQWKNWDGTWSFSLFNIYAYRSALLHGSGITILNFSLECYWAGCNLGYPCPKHGSLHAEREQ